MIPGQPRGGGTLSALDGGRHKNPGHEIKQTSAGKFNFKSG